jgi:adenylyltransferase/sulfurtransferase
MSEALCPTCNEPGRPEIVSAIESDSPLVDQTLAKLGIPAFDIVRIDGEEQSGFFLLEQDSAEITGKAIG